MAQYIWHELPASGLFICIQRKLGVKGILPSGRSSSNPQQMWAGADIPKTLSQGAITLGFPSWGANAEQDRHQAAHPTSGSAQRRKHRAHEQGRDTEPFRPLSALHWKSDECWQEQENSFWGDPGLLVSVPVTITSGCLHRHEESSSPPRQILYLLVLQSNHTERKTCWMSYTAGNSKISPMFSRSKEEKIDKIRFWKHR